MSECDSLHAAIRHYKRIGRLKLGLTLKVPNPTAFAQLSQSARELSNHTLFPLTEPIEIKFRFRKLNAEISGVPGFVHYCGRMEQCL